MNRFVVSTIIKDGNILYQLFDKLTGKFTFCKVGELNKTIWDLIGA